MKDDGCQGVLQNKGTRIHITVTVVAAAAAAVELSLLLLGSTTIKEVLEHLVETSPYFQDTVI